jgi:aromatic-amino-acid transaminase
MASKNDVILTLNQEAQTRKAQGIDVLNGSIGMMFLDSGKLPVSGKIRSILARHVEDEDLVYSSVAGPDEFKKRATHWFLGEAFDQKLAEGSYYALGTPGGTGAVSLAFYLAKQAGSALLLPNLDWPNYEGVAKGFGMETVSYNLFANRAFDLSGLEMSIRSLLQSHSHLTLMINDPCENPTGYSLSPEEWQKIVKLLSEDGILGKVDLIVDAAYIDYAESASKEGLLKALLSLNPLTMVYFCFSFSKTLSFYGLRVGMFASYSENKEKAKAAYDAALSEARALWSVPNHMGMNAVVDLLSHQESVQAALEETAENRRIVAQRAAIFLKEAQAVGLEIYPYKNGFFLTIPMSDAFAVCEKLKEKNIFLAPIKANALRVALCAIPTAKMKGLAKAVKDAMDGVL